MFSKRRAFCLGLYALTSNVAKSAHLSRIWAALPARFPLASRGLEPRFGGILATRIPAQAAAPRISTHFASRISAHSHALGSRAFPRN